MYSEWKDDASATKLLASRQVGVDRSRATHILSDAHPAPQVRQDELEIIEAIH